MKRHEVLSGLMSGAALLLPLTAVPDSHVETARAGAVPSATAHVNFKIVIPRVLSLQVGDGKALAQNAHCTLAPDPGGASPAGSPHSTKTGTRAIICTASMP